MSGRNNNPVGGFGAGGKAPAVPRPSTGSTPASASRVPQGRNAPAARPGSAGASPGGSIRVRARRACEPCRRRKKKCNGKLPCQTCQEYEYECSYGDPDSGGGSPEPSSTSATTGLQPKPQSITEGGIAGSAAPVLTPQLTTIPPLELMPWNTSEETGVLDPTKLRFFDACSAMAFPRALAMSLHAETAPRIHSFAYNVGIRQERFFQQEKILVNFLTFDQARHYADQFFRIIQPIFNILNPQSFLQELQDCWDINKMEDENNLMSEIVCCWVVALGSFYSWPEAFDRETELVQKAEEVLDRATFHEAPSLIRLNHARAWTFRTMYHRSTTRPNITWLSSCMAVQVCESLGLHKEVDTLRIMAPNLPHLEADELEMRRKIFWVAWSINRLASFEYGRSYTFVSGINAKTPQFVYGDETANAVELARTLYQYSDDPLTMKADACVMTLDALASSQRNYVPALAMMRAEIGCGLYRRLRALDRNLAQKSIDGLMRLGRQGLAGARIFIDEGKPWFKIVSTPFQFACTVISIGDLRVLGAVSEALALLYDIQLKFNTHLAREAYETARNLAQIASQAREQELQILRNALREQQQHSFTQSDLDWAIFLNQDYL